MKARFGENTLLLLNSELAVNSILRLIPDRQPGMEVLLDRQIYKRFSKIISRQGLKPISYSGQKDLLEKAESTRVLAIIILDNYSSMKQRYLNKFGQIQATKILFQNRKRPKSVELSQDIYIWEPKGLPRSFSGAVVSISYEVSLSSIYPNLKEQNLQKPRISSAGFIADIFRALKGYENIYRRIDRRPPKILARMLYDFYK